MSPSKWVTALVAVACVSCQAKPDKPVIRIHVTEMACYVENLTARTLYDVRLKLLNPDTRVVSGGGMPYVFWKGGSKNVDVFPGSLPVFQAASSASIFEKQPDMSLPQRTLSKTKNSGSGPKKAVSPRPACLR